MTEAQKPKVLEDFRTSVTPVQFRFLNVFARTGHILNSARACKVSRELHYYWLRTSETYSEAFSLAVDLSVSILEDEAITRAVEGTREPVFYRGRIVGYIAKKSDVILMRLLAARKPKVYAERSRHELTGKDETPLGTVSLDMLMKQAIEDRKRAREENPV